MALMTITTPNGKVDLPLNERNFSTGSKGYGSYGKVELGGKRYQLSCSIVEIGSKGQAPAEAKPAKVIKRKAADKASEQPKA